MRRSVFALAVAVVLVASPTLVQAAPFRVAGEGPLGPCSEFPAVEKALGDLLSRRLGEMVVRCPFPTTGAAAAALDAGQVDLALLDPEAYTGRSGRVRAILTLHLRDDPGRVPVVAGALAGGPGTELGAFRGKRAVFASIAPYDLAVTRRALADQGAGPAFFRQERIAAGADAAASLIRSGQADLLVLNGDAWQRLCRGVKPDERPCADLRIIWRGRPRAEKAWAVSTRLPPALRYRLIGIFMAMHLESPEAFRVAAGKDRRAAFFDAAEADALSPNRAIR